jgi:hypothetical protein
MVNSVLAVHDHGAGAV